MSINKNDIPNLTYIKRQTNTLPLSSVRPVSNTELDHCKKIVDTLLSSIITKHS